MEPHPHRLIAERLWTAIADAEIGRLAELLDDKSMWRMSGRSPLAGSYVGADEVLRFMALVGDLASELRSDLIDIYVSDRGAVMRYSVHATRENRQLDTQQLLILDIEEDRIVEATFAQTDPVDYDRFFSPP